MMSYRVTDPKTGTSTVFPSEAVATAYARNIKGATVTPADVACSATVTKCAEGASGEVDYASERADELYVETATQARLYGASSSEALDEAAAVVAACES
jgi:hypothetical protein